MSNHPMTHNQKTVDQVKQDLIDDGDDCSAEAIEACIRLATLIPECIRIRRVAAWVEDGDAVLLAHDSATTRQVTIYVSDFDDGLQYRMERIDEDMLGGDIGWTPIDDTTAITRMFEWVTGSRD